MLVAPTMFDEYDVSPMLISLTKSNTIKWRKRYIDLNDNLGDGYICSHNGVELNLITKTRTLHFGRYKFLDMLELLLVVEGYIVDSNKDECINTINRFFDGLCIKQGHSLTIVEGDNKVAP